MRYKNMETCECDRCSAKDTLTIDAPDQARWHEMQRYTETGTVQPFLLCESCYEKFLEFQRAADANFAKWMGAK